MEQVRIGEELFREGLRLAEYFRRVPRTRAQQETRYEEEPGPGTLAHFRSLKAPCRVVVLTQEGCPDSAWAVPRILRLLDEAPGCEWRVFFREEHPELQEMLIVNGKRQVPVVAPLDEEGRILAIWGPRPRPIQRFVEASVGRVERTEWYPKVLAYYQGDGLGDLYAEMRALFPAGRARSGERDEAADLREQ